MPKERDIFGQSPLTEFEKRASYVIRIAIMSALMTLALLWFVSAIGMSMLGWATTDRDDTDPRSGGRSGIVLYTDCLTGLQYLSAKNGGMTPRLGLDGAHLRGVCN